jgi:hypothetical protein
MAIMRRDVRFTPESGHSSISMSALGHYATKRTAAKWRLFDHLVGSALECEGHREAERFSSLQVDNEFDLRRLLYR